MKDVSIRIPEELRTRLNRATDVLRTSNPSSLIDMTKVRLLGNKPMVYGEI